LWIYYAAQILLFGAEFTQVYANTYGTHVEPQEHAVKVERTEIEVPSDRESHESAPRVGIANEKGPESGPMR
jgi:membrane protein